MSNVWRGITENAKILCEGTKVAVGNGKNTLFWDHIWATKKPLRSYITSEIPTSIDGATVEELEINVGWKWHMFADHLPEEVIKEIDAHELKEDSNMGDLYYWNSSSRGKFTIKSALQIIKRENVEQIDKHWDLIWKVKVQQRIRVFTWLCMHDRIMGNANRVRRHLANDPRCLNCGANEETTLHILRECRAAKEVWRNIGGPALNPEFRGGNLQEWLGKNLKYSSDEIGENEVWPTYFSLTLWWIWKWRNCMVFNRSNEIPYNINGFLLQRFEESWRALGADSLIGGMNIHIQQQVYIKWKFPHVGWFALNTDGAAKGAPGESGGGGIIRDCQGKMHYAFSANFGVCSAFRAEMKALENGLDLAKRMGIKHLMIQMDSLSGIQILKSSEPYGGECPHSSSVSITDQEQ